MKTDNSFGLALWRGAVEPSAGALVTALCTLAVTLIGTAVLAPSLVTRWHQALAPRAEDDYTFVTAAALAFEREVASSNSVVLLGASGTREAIRSESVLADMLGPDATVLNLTTSAQNLWESAALVERLPATFDGLVVLGLSIGRLGADPSATLQQLRERPRLGFRSVRVDNAMRRGGIRSAWSTGVYALDNREYLIARLPSLGKNLLRGRRFVRRSHWYLDREPRTDVAWQRIMERSRRRSRRLPEHMQANLSILREVVDELGDRPDATLVLTLDPIAPRMMRDSDQHSTYQTFRQGVERFAAENHIAMLDPSAPAALSDDDFYDHCHLRSADAQLRFTRSLAAGLNAIRARRST